MIKEYKTSYIAFLFSLSVFILLVNSCTTSPESKISTKKPFEYTETNAKEQNYIDTNEISRAAHDYVIRGSSYELQYRYAEAILEYQDALKFDSASSIYFALGKCYKELKKYDLAVEYANKSITKDSTFVPSYDLLSDIYMLQMKFTEAINICRTLLTLQPNKFRQFRLARLLEYQDIKEATKIYLKILDDGDNDVRVLGRLSDIYEKTRDTVKLIGILEKLHDVIPEKYEVSYDLLDAYLISRNYPKAFELLNNLDNTIPSSEIGRYYGNFGNEILLDTTKNADKQINAFMSKIDNRFYFDWRMQILGAYLSERIKDTVSSDKFLRHSLDIGDSIPEVSLAVSSIYIQRGKNSEAIELLNRNEAKFDKIYRFPLYLGHANTNLGNYQEALNAYYRVLKIDANQLEAWTQIGLIYDRTNKFDSCEIAYEKALSLDRLNPLINNNYAYSLTVRGKDIERAQAMIRVALDKDPNNSSYLDTYGWIQYNLENYDKALEYTLKSISAGEVGAEVYEHLGYIYLKLGMSNKAIESWRKSLDLGPENQKLMDELKKITK